MNPPAISIVIPTFNGMATLPEVFDAIAAQDLAHAVEIVAVDSGSTDGTRDLAHARATTVLEIPTTEFNHGVTRNLGIEASHGDLVVLLVQDATPISPIWLSSLVAPFNDPTTAGAFARQLPRPEASALTRMNLERWVAGRAAERTVRFDDPAAFTALPPIEQLLAAAFDNVCSCVRRSVWRAHPFAETRIAEDIEWGRDVLRVGHSLVYAARAEVLHSHERPPVYELKRTYLIHRRLHELFGLRTIPTLPLLIRAIAATLRDHRRCLSRHPTSNERWRARALAVAWPLGQYLGGLAAARRWHLLKARGI